MPTKQKVGDSNSSGEAKFKSRIQQTTLLDKVGSIPTLPTKNLAI